MKINKNLKSIGLNAIAIRVTEDSRNDLHYCFKRNEFTYFNCLGYNFIQHLNFPNATIDNFILGGRITK